MFHDVTFESVDKVSGTPGQRMFA
eukprot:COSAG01_NODE_71330_length_256_cov_0.662420_1_plen_23_part_01